jgi:branched-subunit amino acid transport protein
MSDLWVTLGIIGLLTLATRLSFILLLEKWKPPTIFKNGLRFVPLAVLPALIFPEIFLKNNAVVIPPDFPRLVAAVAAGLVAWRTKSTLLTIGIGMLVFYLLRMIFG